MSNHCSQTVLPTLPHLSFVPVRLKNLNPAERYPKPNWDTIYCTKNPSAAPSSEFYLHCVHRAEVTHRPNNALLQKSAIRRRMKMSSGTSLFILGPPGKTLQLFSDAARRRTADTWTCSIPLWRLQAKLGEKVILERFSPRFV